MRPVWNFQWLACTAAAAGILSIGTACSAQDANSADSSPPPSHTHQQLPSDATRVEVDGSALRGTAQYNYDIAGSVTEVAKKADVVAVGHIVGWSDGRLVHDGDESLKHGVVVIKVEEAFSGSTEGGTLFVEISRGGTLINPDGSDQELREGEQYVQRSVEELSKAAPVGVRVLVLGVAAPSDDEIEAAGGNVVVRPWSPPYAGAAMLRGLPQGLFFEDADGSYVSGVVEQSDVEIDDWPVAEGDRAGSFQQLLDELTSRPTRN